MWTALQNTPRWVRAAGLASLVAAALLWAGRARAPASGPGEALRVGTINLYVGNPSSARASQALAALEADLLLVQEWTGQNLRLGPLQASGLRLVFSDPRPGTHGAALWARPGLVSAVRAIPPLHRGPCAMPLVTARLQTAGGPVGLLGVHAPPPIPACWATRRPYLQSILQVIRDGHAARAVGVIPRGSPVIVLGDFNSLGIEAPLRAISAQGFADAHDEGTWHWGPTWPSGWGGPALVALDRIYIPESWGAEGAWTTAIPGADHRAVVADVQAPSSPALHHGRSAHP